MRLGLGVSLTGPSSTVAVAVVGGASAAAPSYPTVTNSRLWLDRNYGLYTDTGGTVAASVTDSIAAWRAVGGSWGTDLVTQATSSKRPTLTADGLQPDGTDDKMTLPSSIAVAGAFTCYLVVEAKSSSPVSIAMGGSTNSWGPQMNYRYSDGNLYAYDDNAVGVISKGYNASSGLRLIRLRRNASNAMFYAATGLAEGSSFGSLAYSYTLTTIMASSGTLGLVSSSNTRFRQIVLVTGDAVTDGGDTDIRTKLLALEGVDL